MEKKKSMQFKKKTPKKNNFLGWGWGNNPSVELFIYLFFGVSVINWFCIFAKNTAIKHTTSKNAEIKTQTIQGVCVRMCMSICEYVYKVKKKLLSSIDNFRKKLW